MSTSTGDERRFQDAFDQFSLRVFAYALRHTDPHSAQDVVADVFLVAWRRIADMPDDPLPWLLVTARNTLTNSRRSTLRRDQLEMRLADAAATTVATATAAEDVAIERATMLTALARLTETEREAVLLVAWDGLSLADAARVTGCSRNAFDARLHRARTRLVSNRDAGLSTKEITPIRTTREVSK